MNKFGKEVALGGQEVSPLHRITIYCARGSSFKYDRDEQRCIICRRLSFRCDSLISGPECPVFTYVNLAKARVKPR